MIPNRRRCTDGGRMENLKLLDHPWVPGVPVKGDSGCKTILGASARPAPCDCDNSDTDCDNFDTDCDNFEFVYRFDYRPPETIFRKGFQPKNLNHVPGVCLYSHIEKLTENYVSFTHSYESLPRIINYLYGGNKENRPHNLVGYIYKVQGNEDFINMNASLRYHLDNGSCSDNERKKLYTVLDEYGWQNEITAIQSVEADRIEWAQHFELQLSDSEPKIHILRKIQNENFQFQRGEKSRPYVFDFVISEEWIENE